MSNNDKQINPSFSLYRKQYDVIKAHADANYDGNLSLALRRIVDEWAQFKVLQLNLPLEAK